MENIHILPTDKPSRLFKDDNQVINLHTHSILKGIFTNGIWSNQNIYITNSEEIKEGDCSFYPPFGVGRNIIINGELCFHIESKDGVGSFTQRTYQTLDLNKKIILTTDQDLINDGVQPVDDDFLEWFVKNPSCEEVEVIKRYSDFTVHPFLGYKIIIPKEEPKQKVICTNDICQGECEECNFMTIVNIEEPKQEKLEEASENYAEQYKYIGGKISFKRGAKWMQERSYSKEDMKSAWDACKKFKRPISEGNALNFNEFIEQFKKK